MNRNWALGKICVEVGAVSDSADVDQRALIFVLEPAWKSLAVEVLDEFLFVSLLRVLSLLIGPLERAIKSLPHEDQPKETRYLASIYSSWKQCWTILQRYRSTNSGTLNTARPRRLNLKKEG